MMLKDMIKRIKKILVSVPDKKKNDSSGKVEATGAVEAKKNNVDTRGFKACSLLVGKDSVINGVIIFEKDNAEVKIGSRVFVGGNSQIIASRKIEIGDDVLIAWGVTIIDHSSHSISFSKRKKDLAAVATGKKDWSVVKIAPVKICDKAWIGFNAIILTGCTIGEGAVVGAGSVVTKDVSAWTIVAGNPARKIREIKEEDR